MDDTPPRPSEQSLNTYLQQIVLRDGQPLGLVVRDAGAGRGKGIFAERDFKQGDVIFRERPLAGMQHVSSAEEILACAHCMRFIGTVEGQIARMLTHVIHYTQQLTSQQGAGGAGGSGSGDGEAGGSGEAGGAASGSGSHAHGDADLEDGEEGEDEELEEYKQRLALLDAHVTREEIAALATGQLKLPHSAEVEMPAPVPCRHACGAQFCSTACEQASWHAHHCLLCPAAPASPQPPTHAPGGSSSGSSSSSCQQGETPLSSGAQQLCAQADRAALAAFYDHAAATNDIFILAARVVAMTALKAAAYADRADTAPWAASSDQGLNQGLQGGGDPGPQGAGEACGVQGEGHAGHGGGDLEALRAAWVPFAAGWKALWWESVAVPEDAEEGEFRQELRDLASSSLDLLRAALPGLAARFPALLSLTTWGALVGMFELNNLDTPVPSPVEDYFLLVDGLPPGPKAAAQAVSARWLDALDRWYDTCAQGTGFFALQSCANHSCDPNAATEGEPSGEVAIFAVKDIKAGEEVTISYIGEGEDGMGYKQRQAALEDYGFVCQCTRCVGDLQKAAARRMQGKARAGVKTGRR